MSTITSLQSTAAFSVSGREKTDVFQDLPLIDRNTRLTVMELKYCDKQIVNELIYRWCRILTRTSKRPLDLITGPSDTTLQDSRRVLIIDLIGSINPVRLATVLKRDERRLRMIGVARGCKINSTFVTLNFYLGRQAAIGPLKLVVVYQDEFYILKSLTLLTEFLKTNKCQVLFVVPRLDRQEQDLLNLTSNYQNLKCDFSVGRREIRPAPPEAPNDSYQTYLNQIYFQRYPPIKVLPDKIYGDLREDGLHFHGVKPSGKPKDNNVDFTNKTRMKSNKQINKQQ